MTLPSPLAEPPGQHAPARLGAGGLIVVLVCTVVSLAAALANGAAIFDADLDAGSGTSPALTVPLVVLWITGVALIGLVLAVRRPTNRVSWLFVALGPLLGFVTGVWSYRWTAPTGWEYAYEWLSVVASWLVVILAGPGLALVFPDGHFPSRRWRPPVLTLGSTFLISLFLLNAIPGKLQELGAQGRGPTIDPAAGISFLEPLEDVLTLGLFGGILGLGALGIAAVIHRRRTGDAVVRAQLAWFLLAIALIPLGIVVSMTESLISADGSAIIGPTLLFLGFGLTPVAVAIAILRYRLFDISVVVRRTIVYGLVVAILASSYAASVVVLQGLLVDATGGGGGLAVAASTLLVAAAFDPLRRRVQDGVDRRFYRSRADVRDAIAGLGSRLRDQIGPEPISTELARVVDEAVHPRHLSIWIRAPASRR